jgi:hypothetical protein
LGLGWKTLISKRNCNLANLPSLFPMMTADIWHGIMKATRPWTWFPHHEVRFFNHLHYQSEPVPGIYLVTSEGRYLVAIRPNGNKRGCRELFKQYAQHIALDEHENERYAEQEQQGRTDCKLLLPESSRQFHYVGQKFDRVTPLFPWHRVFETGAHALS